jgi:hypothetical protein
MAELAAREQVDIAASPHEVWAYRLDFTNLPQYNPAVRDVRRVTDGAGAGGVAGPGAAYEFTLTTPVGPHPVSLVVTDAVEGTRMSADMVGGMVANETFEVEPMDAVAGCRATLTLWLELPEGLAQDKAAQLLARGRADIRGELDLMREVFAARGNP